MAKQAISIDTSKYLDNTRVVIDGNDWGIKLPGAGTELRLSQAQRRIKLLDKKINDGTAQEADYDLYDKLENQSIDLFAKVFNDGTDDNASVRAWIEDTPMSVIMATFEDIKEQAQDADTPAVEEKSDGQEATTA